MKNYFFSVTFLLISCTFSWHANAQIQPPFLNPEIFVSPYGLDGDDDYGVNGDFTDAISPARLMDIIQQNNNIYTGDVTIYFAGGDYYTDFVFFPLANTITNLYLYGGFDPSVSVIDLTTRDLITNETRFHATGNSATLSLAPATIGTTLNCVINGITLTSDNIVNDYALSIVGVDCLVSQFKIENFSTTDMLVWLETGGRAVTFVNCLFADNQAQYLMALCTNIDLVNVTIADNNLIDDMFFPFDNGYIYTLQNSIIYGNTNMNMNNPNTYFEVYHSILENNESWVIDYYGNIFITDPYFTGTNNAPYSCNYYYSPAIASGEVSFIRNLSNYNSDIMDYDVINVYRYYDSNIPPTKIDIGAYQNGNDSYSYYSSGGILLRKNKHSEKYVLNHIYLWSHSHTIFVENVQEGGALIIYNTAGQIVYLGSLNKGTNTIPTTLSAGTYVARTLSGNERDNYYKFIITEQ